MKKILFIFFFISSNVISETYVCKFVTPPTYDGDITLYETHRFERNGKKFRHEVDYQKKYDLNIYNESFAENNSEENFTLTGDQYLILGRGFVVYKIDKVRLKASENYLYVTGEPSSVLADCKVEDTN